MNFALLIITFLIIKLVGFLLIKGIYKKSHFLESVSLGYLIGYGLLTFLLFIFNLSGWKFGLIQLIFILGGFLFLSFLLFSFRLKNENKYHFIIKDINWNFSLGEKLLILLVLIIISASFITNFYWPVKDWDSLVLYDFRAMSFAKTGLMTEAITAGNFTAYPLLTSLGHTIVYLFGVDNPMFIYSLFLFHFCVVFYFSVRRFLSRLFSLGFTFLVLLSPPLFEHSTIAYTNLPYTVYLSLGSIYLYWALKKMDLSLFAIAGILTGLSTWTRSTEPFWLVHLAIIVAIFGWRLLVKFVKSPKRLDYFISSSFIKEISMMVIGFISYAAVFFALQLPWRRFSALLSFDLGINPLDQVSSAAAGLEIAVKQNTLPLVIDYLTRFVVLPYWWLFLLFGFGFLYKILSKNKDYIYFLIVLGHITFIFVGVYIFSVSYSGWEEIHGSLQRMVMFLGPMFIYFIANSLATEKK